MLKQILAGITIGAVSIGAGFAGGAVYKDKTIDVTTKDEYKQVLQDKNDLTTKLAEYKATLDKLTTQRDNLEATKKTLEAELAAAKTAINANTADIEAKQAQLDEVNAQLTECNAKLQRVTANVNGATVTGTGNLYTFMYPQIDGFGKVLWQDIASYDFWSNLSTICTHFSETGLLRLNEVMTIEETRIDTFQLRNYDQYLVMIGTTGQILNTNITTYYLADSLMSISVNVNFNNQQYTLADFINTYGESTDDERYYYLLNCDYELDAENKITSLTININITPLNQ